MSKISELSDGGSLVSTDFLIAVRSGGNVKVKMDTINVDQVDLGDNEFIRLGNSQDLTLVHNASNSIINQAGIGNLLIQKAGTTKASITANGLEFPDNSKAIFGDGSDLQIYHDGSNSYVRDAGTGELRLNSDNAVRIRKHDNETLALFSNDGSVQLYYDNAQKLATSSSGISVTGDIVLGDSNPTITMNDSSVTNLQHLITSSSDNLIIAADNNDVDAGTEIQFYVDGVERMATTATGIDVSGTALSHEVEIGDGSAGGTSEILFSDNVSARGKIVYDHSSSPETLLLQTTGSTGISIDNAQNVSIPNGDLDVTGTATMDGLTVQGSSAGGTYITSSSGSAAGDVKIEHIINSGRNLNTINSESGNGSAIALALATGGSEALRITSTGLVGIGATSPLNSLHIQDSALNKMLITNDDYVNGTTGTSFDVSFGATSGNTYSEIRHLINGRSAWGDFVLARGGGNVGIGTSSPVTNLDVRNNISMGDGTSVTNLSMTRNSANYISASDAAGYLVFRTGSSVERVRIDSSGNALFGKTVANNTDAGTTIYNDNGISVVRDSNTTAIFNRLTNDGEIITIRKDGATVGSIGVDSTRPYIASSSLGLKIAGSEIHATSATGVSTDATYNLGSSLFRWKDLYLSGGAYLGGTGAANKLDDYEEGTFTPAFSVTNATITHDIQTGRYTKVGEIVHFQMIIGTDAVSGSISGSNVLIIGFPFTSSAETQSSSTGLAYDWASELDEPVWLIGSGSTVVTLYSNDNNATTIKGAKMATGGNSNRIYIAGSYRAA